MKHSQHLDAVMILRKAGKTYDEIGSILGVSRQRAQQIFSQAPQAVRFQQKRRKQRAVAVEQAKDHYIRSVSLLASTHVPDPIVHPKSDYALVVPIVYAYMKGNEFLYVGQSVAAPMLARPLTAKKEPSTKFERNRHDAYLEATEIHIYKCSDVAHMDALEAKLIVEKKPKYNKQWSNGTINKIRVAPLGVKFS